MFLLVKRDRNNEGKTMQPYRFPTSAELYSLELRARRERQEELGRLLRAGALAVKAAFERAVSQLSAKVARHA
jgi:hypothetical protein